MDARKAIGETFHRSFQLERKAVDTEKRTVEVAFSSETQSVERFFGVEILDHSKSAVRLHRLNNGGAVLFNHRTDAHIGVIEKAWIDSDKVGRALLRFGQSARAKEVFQDIADRVLQHVSVGYVIHAMQREKSEDNKPDVYRVTDWEPLEVSMVPVPADPTVGVGRQLNTKHKDATMKKDFELTEQEQREEDQMFGRTWSDSEKERHRSSQILELAKAFPYDKEWARNLADSAIQRGTSVNQFRKALMDSMQDRQPGPLSLPHDIGLDSRDLQQYSVLRLIQAQLTGRYDEAGHEMEVGRALEKQYGKQPQGVLIPMRALMSQRLLEVGTSQSGASLVGTTHMSSEFIDILRTHSLIVKMGARVLADLQGDVSIPKKTAKSTGSWVAENNAASESTPTFGAVSLSPKSISAWSEYTRKMLLQSSPSIEALVMDDLAAGLGTGVDAAVINGSGQSSQPLGILGQQGLEIVELGAQGAAPTWAKIVELETKVSVANADMGMLGYLTNSKVRGKLKVTEKFADTNGMAIWPDTALIDGFGTLNGYKAGVSNNVPSNLTKATSGTGLSAIIFGNWADVLIGRWSGVADLLIDPYSQSKKGNTIITAFSDVDVALRNVESFAAIIDAVTT
ncbi:MAG: phage major capsid protein [Nitrospira sp.]|nr:phage major capsid protein [Nitrospira sp.]